MSYVLVSNIDGHAIPTGDNPSSYNSTQGAWTTPTGYVQGRYEDYEVKQVEDVYQYPVLTPMQFYMAFTPTERILLKALATTGLPVNFPLLNPTNTAPIAADPIIAEFWQTYQIAASTNSPINTNLPSVKQSIEYLVSPSIEGTPPVIASTRVNQILNGQAQ